MTHENEPKYPRGRTNSNHSQKRAPITLRPSIIQKPSRLFKSYTRKCTHTQYTKWAKSGHEHSENIVRKHAISPKPNFRPDTKPIIRRRRLNLALSKVRSTAHFCYMAHIIHCDFLGFIFENVIESRLPFGGERQNGVCQT